MDVWKISTTLDTISWNFKDEWDNKLFKGIYWIELYQLFMDFYKNLLMKAAMCKHYNSPLRRYTIQFLSFCPTVLHEWAQKASLLRDFAFKNDLFTF